MNKKSILQHIFVGLMFVCLTAGAAFAQTTAFSYQGSLKDAANPANANYDFEFRLFDALAGGAQLGTTLTRNAVAVANGTFAVNLDFGGQFPGANRFLEIRVRPTGGGAFTPLTPRQPVNSSPYSVKSVNADNATNATNATTATNATQLGGVAANQYVITTDPRMTDERAPTAGSANYIQNQNAGAQAASNFNISGDGTAGGTLSSNIVNATTQFNINGNHVLSVAGTNNVFAGVGAGGANTGSSNSFFGGDAGFANTTGFDNSFFGGSAGFSNTTGVSNSFFGSGAGFSNTTGASNLFFGRDAGSFNTTGGANSFFGRDAGLANTGSFNSFFGRSAGDANTTGGNNTIIGTGANVASGSLTFATAIGAGAVVSTSNTIVLGRPFLDTVVASSRMQVRDIPLLPSAGAVCFVFVTGELLQCGGSSLRWKTNVQPFRGGLEIVRHLRPITYNWKESGLPDIGLGAEDVAQVAPAFVFTNTNGEVEGVKYERLNLLLINAVNEQQTQIEAQTALIKQQEEKLDKQQSEIDALKTLVCLQNPTAKICVVKETKP